MTPDEKDKRDKAIATVKEAWLSLVEAAPEHPGDLVDVSHVRVLDGEGEHVDAAVAIIGRGKVSRAGTQGLGDSFESACVMLAQVFLLRASLLRSTSVDAANAFSYDD